MGMSKGKSCRSQTKTRSVTLRVFVYAGVLALKKEIEFVRVRTLSIVTLVLVHAIR